jgi:hippurate hydrolase
MKDALNRAESQFSEILRVRRELHQIPEKAFEEEKTAAKVIEELEAIGLPYEYDGVGSGVIARLKGDKPGPTVAIRAELDGLPGDEETGLDFESRHDGWMHACGHDVHMANVLGAAMLLAENPPEAGEVCFVFQPAEETGGGSRTILNSGYIDDVEAIFAAHVSRHYDVGEIMVRDGVMTAQSDRFYIDVKGEGGHGARPHRGTDAVVITGALINSLQTIVSREVDPHHPSVVTIGQIEAGSAPNIIAETARLEGSIRSTSPEVRDELHEGVRRMVEALADVHGAEIEVEIDEGYPPTVNSERETSIVRRAARDLIGDENISADENPSMGSEDFAYFLQQLPGCYFRLGAKGPGEEFISLHSPSFTVNEEVLKYGAGFFDHLVRSALRSLQSDD